MQGHVLSPITRQEIHLITCEAEDGVWGPDRGGLCSLSTLPEMGGGVEKVGGGGKQWQWGGSGEWGSRATVKRARGGREEESWTAVFFQHLLSLT